jgi:aldehyde dehydrogenase (NAD+)
MGKSQKGFPSLLNFPSKDYIYKDPYGKVLLLLHGITRFSWLLPLVSAVAAEIK